MLDARSEQELTGGGDTLLHYHLQDRATNAGLQSDARRTTITADYTVRADDDFLLVDTTSAAINLTLPLARNGKEFEFILMDATNTLTVTPASGETINGAAAMVLSIQYTAIRLKAISGGWVAI